MAPNYPGGHLSSPSSKLLCQSRITMRVFILLGAALHLFILHTPTCSAAIMEALSPGQSLGAGDKLVSGNGKFTVGFFQLAGVSHPKIFNF